MSAALYPYTVNLQSKVEGGRNKDRDKLAPLRSAEKLTKGTKEKSPTGLGENMTGKRRRVYAVTQLRAI